MPQSNKKLATSLIFLTMSMLLLSFASVPIYNLFCKVTGYGGTTQQESNSLRSKSIGIKPLIIEFDANVQPDLPWQFIAKQRKISILPGQNILVFYEAENFSKKNIIGTAVYNITPNKAGKYFVKIHCFCFEEQLLKTAERVLMPVSFYIDPAFENDPEMADVSTITLSYSFFKVREAE